MGSDARRVGFAAAVGSRPRRGGRSAHPHVRDEPAGARETAARSAGAEALVRPAGDGGTVEAWMFDDTAISPKHLVGPYRDDGFEAKAETPEGVVRVTCESKGADRVFHLFLGDTLLALETYRPAAK